MQLNFCGSHATRLPEKCYLPFDGCNVLEHVIKRAKHFQINPIVCTTYEKTDDKIVEIARKHDLYILSDEIYSNYSNKEWTSILSYNY